MSIDCDCFQVPNPFTRKNILKYKSKQCDAWFVFCFFKIIVCKDDVFFALKATNVNKFRTRVYRTATTNGIDCCNNQTLGYCIATTHLSWMGLKCYNYRIDCVMGIFFVQFGRPA